MTWREPCEASGLCRPCQAPFSIQFDLAGNCFEANCLVMNRPDGTSCGCEVIRLVRQGPCRIFAEPGALPSGGPGIVQTVRTTASSAFEYAKGVFNFIVGNLHIILLIVIAYFVLTKIGEGPKE